MSSNGYILHNELKALYGIFTELKPYDNPVTSLIGGKGVRLLSEKDYGMTFHTNGRPSASNTKPDAATPTLGSSAFTSGSNIVNAFYEAAAVTWARKGDQGLDRTLAWRSPSNPSVEPDPMDRAKSEAMARIKGQLEWVGREGTYTYPHGGTGGTTAVYEQRGYRYSDGLTVGTSTGGVRGTGTLGTYGTLSYSGVMDFFQGMWDKELWTPGDQMILVCNSTVKRAIGDLFISQLNFGKNGESINVAGVNILRFVTDFGPVDIVMSHNYPTNEFYALNLSYMEMVGRPVPGKGLLFESPIAQALAGDMVGIYGELGLNYQTGSAHGRMTCIGSTVSGGFNTGRT